jgi:PII-like signaling protein
MISADGSRLRIYFGESDKYEKQPLYEWIITQAKAKGLAGATVLRGLMGFGANTRVIHTFKIERLSEDLPIIIELVDAADKIEAFLSFVEQHIHSGLLATMEKVEVRFYRGDQSSKPKTTPQ